MTKLISSFLAVVFLVTVCPLFAVATNISSTSDRDYSLRDYNEACLLYEALFEEMPLGEPTNLMTRGEFANLLVKYCNIQKEVFPNEYQCGFADVTKESPYFFSTSVLLKSGVLSEAENFEPNRLINKNEAIKMVICSAGYSYKAESRGGYPNGYNFLASELELFEGFSSDQEVSFADALILMRNYMLADALETENISVDKTTGEYVETYAIGRINYLSYYFGYSVVEGIVRETQYNSYSMDHDLSTYGSIKIDESVYNCKKMPPEFLGKNVFAVYNDEDEILCFWENKKNHEVVLFSENYAGITGLNLSCFEEGKKRKYSLDESYIVVYNGRRVSKINDEMLDDVNGTITLLDNDSDGKYEIVKIKSKVYGIIQTVDEVYNTISLSEPDNIYISMDDAYSIIMDSEGNLLEVLELSKGMAVSAMISQDNRLVEIDVLNKTISGKITMLDAQNSIVEIDGVEYSMSNAFKRKYFDAENILKVGTDISVVLTDDDLIVCLSSKKETMRYGYLKEVFYSGRTLQFYVFTEAGEFVTFDGASKIMLDGKKGKTAADVVAALGGDNFTPQVIKYELNSEGKLSKIDIADNYNDYVAQNPQYSFGDELPVNNSLMNYGKRPSNSSEYRSSYKGMIGFANLSSTVIFAIPVDIEDEEEYSIYKMSNLTSGVSYDWTLYDISPTGQAGAATIIAEINSVSKRNWPAMIVDSVKRGVDDEDEDVWIIGGWANGGFGRYTVKDEVMDEMNASSTNLKTKNVGVGDIICIDRNGDEIKHLMVEFEYSQDDRQYTYVGKHKEENRYFTNLSVEQGATDKSFYGSAPVCYVEGYAYNSSSDQLYVGLTRTLDTFDNSIFEYSNLRLMIASSRIVCFDRETGELRPMSISQINTYKGSGFQADHLIIRNKDDSNDAIFVIR